jgi:hypothetical protein
MGKWVVVGVSGADVWEYATYYPAEQAAKRLGYAKVVYRGVRGLEVVVWPLTP